METLTDLLFELSNDDRLKILLELEKGPRNLTKIAKDLDFTAQGTSRNVERLVQISMIMRNPEGDYVLTSSRYLCCKFPFLQFSSKKSRTSLGVSLITFSDGT